MNVKKVSLLIFFILLIDQIVKIWIKLTMEIGDSLPVFGGGNSHTWFYIHFVENEGMAWGMQFGGDYGKLLLSIFRLIAIGGIGYYLYTIIQKKYHKSLIISLSLILAGAIGNMIDSAFYGLIFSASGPFETAVLFPSGGGYAGFLHGKVVDMFYFPLMQGYYPTWLPWIGGDYFEFFRPVFNIADSSISIGVVLLIIFQKRFQESKEKTKPVIHDEIEDESLTI